MEGVLKFQIEIESRVQSLLQKLQCFAPLIFKDESEEAVTSEKAAAELMGKLEKIEAKLDEIEQKLQTCFPWFLKAAVEKLGGNTSSNPIAQIPVNNKSVAVAVAGKDVDTYSNKAALVPMAVDNKNTSVAGKQDLGSKPTEEKNKKHIPESEPMLVKELAVDGEVLGGEAPDFIKLDVNEHETSENMDSNTRESVSDDSEAHDWIDELIRPVGLMQEVSVTLTEKSVVVAGQVVDTSNLVATNNTVTSTAATTTTREGERQGPSHELAAVIGRALRIKDPKITKNKN